MYRKTLLRMSTLTTYFKNIEISELEARFQTDLFLCPLAFLRDISYVLNELLLLWPVRGPRAEGRNLRELAAS